MTGSQKRVTCSHSSPSGRLAVRTASSSYICCLQVVSTTGKERYSTAFFMDADYDCIVDTADVPACQVLSCALCGVGARCEQFLRHQPATCSAYNRSLGVQPSMWRGFSGSRPHAAPSTVAHSMASEATICTGMLSDNHVVAVSHAPTAHAAHASAAHLLCRVRTERRGRQSRRASTCCSASGTRCRAPQLPQNVEARLGTKYRSDRPCSVISFVA